MNKIKRFEVGRIYQTRFPGDHDLIIRVKIVGRTERTVKWIMLDEHKKVVKTCRPAVFNNAEYFYPDGRYSMAPIITASRVEK